MNNKIKSAIVACALISAWTPHLLAMGNDYQIDENGNIRSQQPEWPSGLAELINAGSVFHGHWVNANSEFFFLGNTGALTRFLSRYSSLTNTPLVVVLHEGSARRSELWGEKPTDRYDWKVIVLKRGQWPGLEKSVKSQEQWVVTVDVWVDHDIRLADLVIPKNVQVKSAGEVEAFVAKHNAENLAAKRVSVEATAPATPPDAQPTASDEVIGAVGHKGKFTDPFEFINHSGGGIPYKEAKEQIDPGSLPRLHDALKNPQYASKWPKIAQLIGYVGGDAESARALVEYARRAEDWNALTPIELFSRMMGKGKCLMWVGKNGDKQSVAVLRQALTEPGAKELIKAWMDGPLESWGKAKGNLMGLIRGAAAMGLMYSQDPEGMRLVEQQYQQAHAARASGTPVSEYYNQLVSAMAVRDLIAAKGKEGYLRLLGSAAEVEAYDPHLRKYDLFFQKSSKEAPQSSGGPQAKGYADVLKADAIVIGKVVDIEPKRYALTLFERGSEGKKPELKTFYNLAVLHPETVIKAETDSMVNKADKSNPVAWMHMAYRTPGQQCGWNDLSCPTAGKGEYRIWFLCRDLIFTGHYFVRQAEDVTESRIQEIRRLVAEEHEQKQEEIRVDLTNPVEAATNATWSEPDNLTVTTNGLGWDGKSAASRDGWIQTKPLALGLSWRPIHVASVRVTIQPPPRKITLGNGQKTPPDFGAVYARYAVSPAGGTANQPASRVQPPPVPNSVGVIPGRPFLPDRPTKMEHRTLAVAELRDKCSKQIKTFERLRADLDAAKRAYVNLLLAE